MKNKTVLVTGASGFIATHCVAQLLEQGYHVRGTLRSMKRELEYRQTIARLVDADNRLKLVQADLLNDTGWDEATRGCDYVLHVASPFPLGEPKDENELIRPAVEGTLRVLKAAAKNGVRRVVQTSSIAAIGYGHLDEKTSFDESDWSVTDSPTIDAYAKSKTLAEKAAWDFVNNLPENNKMELAVINPGLVMGPVPDTHARTSGELVYALLKAKYPGLSRTSYTGVDVRDVAAAHLAAMTTPEAAGQRFICVAESFWIQEVALLLKKHFGARGYKIATRILPDWVVKLVALFDAGARATVDDLGVELHFNNSRIKEVLNWQPRGMKEMVLSMAESMIELGMV